MLLCSSEPECLAALELPAFCLIGAWCRFCIRTRSWILCSSDLKTVVSTDWRAFLLTLLATNDADVDVIQWWCWFSILQLVSIIFPKWSTWTSAACLSEVLLEDREIENVGQGRADFIWSYASVVFTMVLQFYMILQWYLSSMGHALAAWLLFLYALVFLKLLALIRESCK